jgi:SAM-dependent methyltransferase
MLPKESYSQNANPDFEAELALRTAAKEGAFFLPYLRAGMRLLDLGCGPGSITLGLAEKVAPGEVVGVDLQPSQVAQAQELSAARGVKNVRFEVADIYQLSFPDGSFDAVFAHVVLMHLREPVRALTEMRRVLRPGGIVGVRDCDWGGRIHAPITPLLEQWYALTVWIRQRNGGDPFMDVITAACCSMPDLHGRRQACLFRLREHRRKPDVVPPSSKPNFRALRRPRWRKVGSIRKQLRQ